MFEIKVSTTYYFHILPNDLGVKGTALIKLFRKYLKYDTEILNTCRTKTVKNQKLFLLISNIRTGPLN